MTNLEIIAKANAVEAPKFVLDAILNDINDKPVIALNTRKQHTPWYSIAASFAAIMFAVTAFLLYQKNSDLIRENNVVVDELFDLRSDIENNNNKLDNVMRQLMKLNNPQMNLLIYIYLQCMHENIFYLYLLSFIYILMRVFKIKKLKCKFINQHHRLY